MCRPAAHRAPSSRGGSRRRRHARRAPDRARRGTGAGAAAVRSRCPLLRVFGAIVRSIRHRSARGHQRRPAAIGRQVDGRLTAGRRNSASRWACRYALAQRNNALVGMHRQFRHTPPSRSFSTSTVFSPSCAARMAHTYPPVPPPMMIRSDLLKLPSTIAQTGGDPVDADNPRWTIVPGHVDCLAATRLCQMAEAIIL